MKMSLLHHSIFAEGAHLLIPKVLMEDDETEQWLFREGMKVLFALQEVHESIGHEFGDGSALTYFQNIKGNFCIGLKSGSSLFDWVEFQAHIEDRVDFLNNLDWVESVLEPADPLLKTPPRRPHLVLV